MGVVWCAFCVGFIVWKRSSFGRILAPRTRQKEDTKLEDLLEKDDKDAADTGADMNPVLRAKLAIEADQRAKNKDENRPGAGAAGALGRLLKAIGGSFGGGPDESTPLISKEQAAKDKRAAEMRALDRNLAAESKEAREVEKKRLEDERKYKQAEEAAQEAARRR